MLSDTMSQAVGSAQLFVTEKPGFYLKRSHGDWEISRPLQHLICPLLFSCCNSWNGLAGFAVTLEAECCPSMTFGQCRKPVHGPFTYLCTTCPWCTRRRLKTNWQFVLDHVSLCRSVLGMHLCTWSTWLSSSSTTHSSCRASGVRIAKEDDQ